MTQQVVEPFMFTEKEVAILKNFSSGINSQIIIKNTGFGAINNSKSVIGNYTFETPYEFPDFGLYEASEFLTVLGAFSSDTTITPKEKFLLISDKDSKVSYYTTAETLLPKVPVVEEKFSKIEPELIFSLSAEKLAIILKMANILKSKFLYFESDKKKVRITVADEIESSTSNNYEITIDEGISANRLTEPVKINLTDFKLLAGDYEVKISTKISKWQNLNGAIYYLSMSI